MKNLAGWSHFAQFTIAVVNKDPKKSKYSGECGRRAGIVVRGSGACQRFGLKTHL
jgi:hypothetical protein